jgi:hypothetical protein
MKKAVLFSFLLGLLFSSCDKEKRTMRKESGVWEIKRWESITYNNGTVTRDTIIENLGYIALWNNNLNGFNECHYHFNGYYPPCWTAIANNATHLSPMDDVCYWENDMYGNDRLTLEYTDDLSSMIAMMFTITKSHKEKQEWIFVGGGSGSSSTMDSKDIFTLERAAK